jgi:hypothetical protein
VSGMVKLSHMFGHQSPLPSDMDSCKGVIDRRK